MTHKTKRRPGSGEIGLALSQHDGVQVDSILVDQTERGEALRQVRTGNFDLSVALCLQRADRALKIMFYKRRVGPTDFSERETTHFGCFRHAAAKARSAASHSG